MISIRQLLPAAILAATALFGASAVGTLATASAAPMEWDIEDYDHCMKGVNHDDPSEQLAWTRKCCLGSGGVWNDAMGKCQSPPMEAQQAGAPITRSPRNVPLHILEQNLTLAP